MTQDTTHTEKENEENIIEEMETIVEEAPLTEDTP